MNVRLILLGFFSQNGPSSSICKALVVIVPFGMETCRNAPSIHYDKTSKGKCTAHVPLLLSLRALYLVRGAPLSMRRLSTRAPGLHPSPSRHLKAHSHASCTCKHMATRDGYPTQTHGKSVRSTSRAKVRGVLLLLYHLVPSFLVKRSLKPSKTPHHLAPPPTFSGRESQ